jgi:hypothetical protein
MSHEFPVRYNIMRIESQKRYRCFLIFLLYFVFIVIGVRIGIFWFVSIERQYFHSLVFALILTHICIVDSRIVGKPLSIFSYWLVFILYDIAVPVCMIRARGIRGLGIVVCHLLGLVLVYITAAFVTSLLVHGTFYPY